MSFTHVVIYLNGHDDVVEQVIGFTSREAAQAWIDDGRDGAGYLIHEITHPPVKTESVNPQLTWESTRADHYRVSLDGGLTWQTTRERKVDLKPGQNNVIVQAISGGGRSGFEES